VVLLILESLGSTELLFILVMALVFFGPRKLPQMSRSLGKSLADFRRASEDFKQTWVREVTLENAASEAPADPASPLEDASNQNPEEFGNTLQPPTVEAVAAELVVPRQLKQADVEHSDQNAGSQEAAGQSEG
jgi:TatA/E family protein of Tat protein translocase